MRKKLVMVILMAILLPIGVIAATVPPAQEITVPSVREFHQEDDVDGIVPPAREMFPLEECSLDASIIDVVFVCNLHTTGSPPRNLVISTPGSFTVPGSGSMEFPAGWLPKFQGWSSASGNVWNEGARICWNVAVSGTYTLTANWTFLVRVFDDYGNYYYIEITEACLSEFLANE